MTSRKALKGRSVRKLVSLKKRGEIVSETAAGGVAKKAQKETAQGKY